MRVCEITEAAEIIELIDNAKLLDENTGLVKTPMGLTSVNNLSTGCKTALNVAFVREHPELNISKRKIFPRIAHKKILCHN